MDFQLFNRTLADNDHNVKLETGKREVVRIFVHRRCPECGIKITGDWEFPSYRIPTYYINKYAQEVVSGAPVCIFTDEFNGSSQYIGGKEYTWNTVPEKYLVDKATSRFIGNDWEQISGRSYRAIEHPEILRDIKKLLPAPAFLRQYRDEYTYVYNLKKCPVCDAVWADKDDRRYENYNRRYSDEHGAKVGSDGEKLLEAIALKTKEQAENYINSIADLSESNGKTLTIAETAQLKDYLNSVIYIEKNIQLFTTRLEELYYQRVIKGGESVASKLLICKKDEDKIEALSKQYHELENYCPEHSVARVKMPRPAEPVQPQKPQEPVMQTPGLFNKKRVLAENAQAIAQYEINLKQYNEEYRIYQESLADYRRMVEEIENKEQTIYMDELEKEKQNHQRKCELAKQEWEQAVAVFEDKKKNLVTPEILAIQLVNNEIEQVEELLKKLYVAKNKAYACGVIFEKYHYFVAVSMFYEYLASGRCASLEGPDGAYNIYEAEIRANIVISQMAEIVNSLEKIKDNQFMIYKAINEVNKELSRLNSGMDTLVSEMGKMNESVESIATAAETISYNTGVTAYYAKKNAELTDALGFMMALK